MKDFYINKTVNPKGLKKDQYDAVIIGAGIGGLVCGCYLAKAGMKVLIVEKNAKPGGYCTSFSRNGFMFDACVHSLGSLRDGGIVATVLNELNIDKRINIKRHDPSDVIITSDYKICFWSELDKTVREFQSAFSKEAKKIKNFFDYLVNSEGVFLANLRKKTFNDLLKEYFIDNKLKAILSLPLLGNGGLPPSLISAFAGIKIYKEFMIDGGYYPEKGMQELPDFLAKRFKELGGGILFSKLVKKIKIKDNQAEGITLIDNIFISAKYTVSNVDARQTFLDLIGEKEISKEMVKKLNNMRPSLSMFILYLGVDDNLDTLPQSNLNIWFLPNYDIEDMYLLANKGKVENLDWFLVRILSDKKSVIMLVNAPFINEKYWKINKKRLIDIFIKKIDRVIPNLSKHLIIKDAATPATLYRQTLNYKGASYGWAGILSQFAIPGFSQATPIENLYLTGHWTTLAQGIPGVSYLGRDTANIILRREKRI